ncbi:tRNA (guanosine(46)-N7)-methyltransferase TrmB [Pelagicoccus albus]|uniref:tRNA (guanine-N(7)-)-methyltransferase n=1 Tax=Pelagicoccus albus TaxID=415222 RepID=A0A7X1E9H5_9BACT|nr:tRNA (guanosine(46)-N7)-methyltransferase TrmB [Pelagicoccus albus]
MNAGYDQHLELVKKRRDELRFALANLYSEPIDLTLEIGSGHGHWLVKFAESFPEKTCLGLDIIGDRIERARKKANSAGISNVQFLKAEAFETLDLLPKEVRLKEVFVLFPDPWPKKRHWKNRLFCVQFLEQLAQRCETGVRCHFRTDHEPYFEWALEVVEQQSGWSICQTADWPFEQVTVFQERADAFNSLILERV